MGFNAKILADSVSPDGVRLTTLEVTLPRCVLAELNTHRVFSRNSASSRAIPVAKMLERVRNDPFVPVYWGKNQKGMQAEEELSPADQIMAREKWLRGRDAAIDSVQSLLELNVHKQITNRILEPWLWHTVIVTSTEWDNFWGLRCHPAAQPEIRKAAELMRAAYDASSPKSVNYDDWHLPLLLPGEAFDLQVSGMCTNDLCKVSAGRCARVSYLTHDGKRDPKADIEMCDRLVNNGHMSPMEHTARPMTWAEAHAIHAASACGRDPKNEFCGNLRGWVSLRKTIPHEDNFLARGVV